MTKKVTAKLAIAAIAALLLSTGSRSLAQQSLSPSGSQPQPAPSPSAVYGDSQWGPDQTVQLFAQDLKLQKKQIIAANMDLTEAEAEKFWPVYDRYAADLAKIYDTKLELVKEYLENSNTMNGDEAETYIRRRAALEQDVMQLRLRYVPDFRKVLSGRETALFFQIEWRLDLLINLQLAQAPVIDP